MCRAFARLSTQRLSAYGHCRAQSSGYLRCSFGVIKIGSDVIVILLTSDHIAPLFLGPTRSKLARYH